MRAEGLLPDELVYRILLESCGKAGTPDLAFKILKEMQTAGFIPDASVYTVSCTFCL